jgi:hypothetical protein
VGNSKVKSPDFPIMPMSNSRQIKQPQSMIALEYYLLHNGKNDSSGNMSLLRTGCELFDFYEANIP